MCYICGESIPPDDECTDDHRVQKLLLDGAQPRRRGFDYGGVAPTHRKCNSEFREEVTAGAALRILRAMHLPDAMKIGVHPDDPSIEIMALNAEIFGEFSDAELAFFKMKNVSGTGALPTPDDVRRGEKNNLLRQAVPNALSVLLKSSVALLVDRHGLSASASRHIWATPWVCDPEFAEQLRLDGAKPFHEEVFWSVNRAGDVLEVRYYAHGIVVYFWFLPEPRMALEKRIMATLPNADHWLFQGSSLRDLRQRPWKLIHQGNLDGQRNVACGCGSGRRFKHCHGNAVFERPIA